MSFKFVFSLIALMVGATTAQAWPKLWTNTAPQSEESTKPADPKVTCEIMYSEKNEAGGTVDFARGENIQVTTSGVSTTNHGFKLSAMLERQCAADGGPCASTYALHARISKDKVSSSMQVDLMPGPSGWSRYSFELTSGSEQGFVNCDHDTRD